MKLWKKSLWACAFLMMASSGLWAESEKVSRPCKKEDLVGTWDMVSVKPVIDQNDPVFYPYQRFVFGRDSSMKFMSSDKPFTPEWVQKFERQAPEIDYSLNEKGLLTLTWQKTPHGETAVCAYVLKDVPPDVLAKIPLMERSRLPKKGNVTLSYLNNSGKIAYQKILTRVA